MGYFVFINLTVEIGFSGLRIRPPEPRYRRWPLGGDDETLSQPRGVSPECAHIRLTALHRNRYSDIYYRLRVG